MDTTVTIEFFSDTKEHLKALEQRLKQERDVDVDLVEPRDATAPALVAIGIKHYGARAENAAQRVAQTLYNFLEEEPAQNRMLMLTIEGDRVDVRDLSVEQIKEIILQAREREE